MLLATISFTTYSGLAGGVHIWKRIEASIQEVDLALGWKKLRKDLVAHVPNREIGFIGKSRELFFPGLVVVKGVDDVVHQEVGRIRYHFNESENTICREETTYAKISEDMAANCREVFSHVGNVSFKYYGVEKSSDEPDAAKSGGWYTEWLEGGSPIAVRMEITLKGAGEKGEIKKQYTATFPQDSQRE